MEKKQSRSVRSVLVNLGLSVVATSALTGCLGCGTTNPGPRLDAGPDTGTAPDASSAPDAGPAQGK